MKTHDTAMSKEACQDFMLFCVEPMRGRNKLEASIPGSKNFAHGDGQRSCLSCELTHRLLRDTLPEYAPSPSPHVCADPDHLRYGASDGRPRLHDLPREGWQSGGHGRV